MATIWFDNRNEVMKVEENKKEAAEESTTPVDTNDKDPYFNWGDNWSDGKKWRP